MAWEFLTWAEAARRLSWAWAVADRGDSLPLALPDPAAPGERRYLLRGGDDLALTPLELARGLKEGGER